MSDILCRWLNSELRLSRPVEPLTLAKDLSNGYLLGEVLHKHKLQEDFHQFSKHSTANAKLNNFTRLEPTLQLLGVTFDLGVARAVMQGQQGAASRLLYQLYILLHKKKRSGLTSSMLETMQPAAVSRLHRVEKQIYTQRLRTMVKREADVKMQKIAQRFDKRVRDVYSHAVLAELEQEEQRRHLLEQIRLQDIQKHRQARRKQQEIMDRIHTATIQIPKPPATHSVRDTSKHRHLQQADTQSVGHQISEFEKNRKRTSASCPTSISVQLKEEQMEEWNNAYVQKIRKRLEEDTTAREQREKRRRRALILQLHTHQTHEEMLREEQLIGRLMRESRQEKRIAVQLMQIREQKEVLRQNRILREKEIHTQTQREFQLTQQRERALLQQDQINREAELRKERELHRRLAAERAQSKHLKHLNTCRGILEHIVDLATKAGEYRLLTANLIPQKLMREWKELWLNEKPLYEMESSPEQAIELEKLHILNEQDYTDYTAMTAEWAWPDAESKAPPPNNDILGHIVSRLRSLLNGAGLKASTPELPHASLRACVLGKVFSGKTTHLTRINQAHRIHILSADVLIQEALEARGPGEAESEHGAAVEEALTTGNSVPDVLLVNIITDAIRRVPTGEGWVLDGFPVDISQARLLEKALGGANPDHGQTEGQHTSHELAVDRYGPQAPPTSSSVLQLAVLLEVSDEKVLERHQQLQGKEMNIEETAPPAGESQEQTQVQHRIVGFQDSWSRLEDWFGVEQKILVKVNADEDEDTVYRTLETLLLHAMDTEDKGPDHTSEIGDITKADTDHSGPAGESAAEAPPAEPGSSSWVYVDDQLPKELSENLLTHWENVCSSYVSNVKAVMQNLRTERNLIIHHLYNIREEYKQYLMRPDLKQEFLFAWQCEYNSVSDDMRHEEETKSELHQRLEDLRERLWDICDKRKEEATQEKSALTEDGWLQNHTSVLINHYCTLIQVEVDRFQYTLRLLRDYYSGVYRSAVPETAFQFTSISLLPISNQPERKKSSAGSTASERFTKSSGKKDSLTEEKKKPRLPSADSKKNESAHPDEKLLQEFLHTAATAISQLVISETQQLEQEENEELQQQIEKERTSTQSLTPASAAQKKGGKKKGAGVRAQEPILPTPVEENEEEVQKRKMRNKMRLEYRTALQHEERSVSERLERVKMKCVETLRSLQSRAEAAHREMEEWSAARFLSEVNSVDQLASIVRHHIESGSQITHELTLACSNFLIDGDTRVVLTPPPLTSPITHEVTNQGSPTVQQLYSLHFSLFNVAPTGLVSCDTLCEVLTLCMGSDVLFEAWMRLTDSQDCGMVDWRQFLLSASRPWPRPSQTQLINTLTHFKEIDKEGGGVITLQQYLQVDLWFPTDRELPVPDSTKPQLNDRLTNLRKFFFTLFSDSAHSPPVCDYMNMLLYFCSHPDPAHGFTRALSLVTQHTLHYTHTHSTGLLQSYVTGDVCDEEEEVFEGDEGGVSVDDVLKVVTHRGAPISSHTTARNIQELKQDLMEVFESLGYNPDAQIPFTFLSQQPLLQQLMNTSQYLLGDLSRVMEFKQGSSVEDPAGEIPSTPTPGEIPQ